MSGEEATTPSVGGEAGEWRGGSMAANRGRAGTAAESATPVVIERVMTEVKGATVGVTAGATGATVRVSAPSLHDAIASAKRPPQRSPFAIQELLGLGSSSDDHSHHNHHAAHHNHHNHHAALHSQAMFGARMAYFNAQAAVAAAQAFLPQHQPASLHHHHHAAPPPEYGDIF
ncbi:unnamed protein product [Nesidiocoris tenuis]|uniref:Uncharacterized protein n=1 Tax=Nesidiocoris tenuis TaxID=355587 RepID=A0A6H5GTD9_9HEMI|nr:unnamed protein product [Nesidiocoris tenuis]